MGMYRNMPADAACVFTISDEVPVPRSFPSGWPPINGPRNVVWDSGRHQIEADAIRRKYPEQAQAIVRPSEFHHLYQYFDVVDLWYKGVNNILHVLNILCDENDAAAQRAIEMADIVDVVDDWVYKWLTHEANRQKLALWDQQSDVLDILTPADRTDVGPCDGEVPDIIRGAFKYWHGTLPKPTSDRPESVRVDLPETSADDGMYAPHPVSRLQLLTPTSSHHSLPSSILAPVCALRRWTSPFQLGFAGAPRAHVRHFQRGSTRRLCQHKPLPGFSRARDRQWIARQHCRQDCRWCRQDCRQRCR